jgi:xylulokinase
VGLVLLAVAAGVDIVAAILRMTIIKHTPCSITSAAASGKQLRRAERRTAARRHDRGDDGGDVRGDAVGHRRRAHRAARFCVYTLAVPEIAHTRTRMASMPSTIDRRPSAERGSVSAVTELLLGVDFGTSSTKGVLTRPDGAIVASAERQHQTSMPRPGWFEHDPVGMWWTEFVDIARSLTADAPGRIAGVCTSGIGPCVLPADGDGNPLRPAMLYGIDTRAAEEEAELTERFGAEAILERCGAPLTSQAAGPKILWLQHHEPDVWSHTKMLFGPNSFVVHRLTGEYMLDQHTASQHDPMYGLAEEGWIDWAEDVAPGVALPRLLWPGEIAGAVHREGSEATGIPEGTPVAAGTLDAWSEATSAGVRKPGDLMLMYGSTMFMIQVVGEPRPHPRLWLTVGVDPGSRTLAGAMSTSGLLTSWFGHLVGDVPFPELLESATAAPAGSDGLLVLPYFAGERTPLFDPQARGVLFGLALTHGRGHIYRALLESTAFGVRHNLQAFAEAGGGGARLVAVGGGTRGGLWTQIVSDVTGLPQELPEITIGASYGDAWFAGVVAGLVDPGKGWARVGEVVEPDPSTKAVYDELFEMYVGLYPSTREEMHRIAELQTGGRS